MSVKSTIAEVCGRLGAFAVGHAFARRHPGFVRAINYHRTSSEHVDNFRRQLDFYRAHFDNADSARLDAVLAGTGTGPALLISFDDGYRSNYDIAAPLLEEFGFTGWFFVSSGRYRGDASHTVNGEPADDFMSHSELRDLAARGHVIGCHTHSHMRLADTLGDDDLDLEIRQSRTALEAALARPVTDFCWVGGEEWSYSARASHVIVDAGYRRGFTTNCALTTAGTSPMAVERTNIEADWPLARVRFYLSGIMDVVYSSKRMRTLEKIGRLTP